MSEEQIRVVANDFRRQWSEIADDALAAVDRVGRSGWLILGDEVVQFEQAFAEWWGVPYAVGVASGLDAIEIALRSAGLNVGDGVLTTPLTAFATTLAVIRAGGVPVWCDVDESGGMDLALAAEAIAADPSIRYLLPVHLYGHPLEPSALKQIVERTGVTVIEDCAQSAGATRDGRPTGISGVAAATSFYPTKNVGALGDGGMMLTTDRVIAEHARHLRDYGQSTRYVHDTLGLNSRLDELQAAVLRTAVLPRLPKWLERRAEIADQYLTHLADLGLPMRPMVPLGGRSANHLFPVELIDDAPDELIGRLRVAGVLAARHYPFVCQDQKATTGIGYTFGGDVPVARRLAARELSLPIHPFLSDDDVRFVVDACRDAMNA